MPKENVLAQSHRTGLRIPIPQACMPARIVLFMSHTLDGYSTRNYCFYISTEGHAKARPTVVDAAGARDHGTQCSMCLSNPSFFWKAAPFSRKAYTKTSSLKESKGWLLAARERQTGRESKEVHVFLTNATILQFTSAMDPQLRLTQVLPCSA